MPPGSGNGLPDGTGGCGAADVGRRRLRSEIAKYKEKEAMLVEVLKSKIHRVRVTEANLNYVGSITIDEDLLDAAGMIGGEKVQILDINNGERLETYVIKGERGSGCICLNGAAARKVAVDDLVIIVSYALMDFEEAKRFEPSVVFPDSATNRLVK